MSKIWCIKNRCLY